MGSMCLAFEKLLERYGDFESLQDFCMWWSYSASSHNTTVKIVNVSRKLGWDIEVFWQKKLALREAICLERWQPVNATSELIDQITHLKRKIWMKERK
jgi:hypothetical protein